MTEDRTTPAMSTRSDFMARLGFGLYKYGIIAALCLLMKQLAIPLSNPKTIAKWLVMSSILYPLAATAEGISVNKAEMRQSDGGYQLSATYDINLTFAAQQALTHGVPLYFAGEFLMTRSRWYWFDEKIFHGEQTVKLSYNVLTRQYRLSRGTLYQNFASYEDALNILARQGSAAIPAELVKEDSNYIVAARLRLDVAQLPLPLQVNALTGRDWALDSDWYRWMVRPADVTLRGKSKAE